MATKHWPTENPAPGICARELGVRGCVRGCVRVRVCVRVSKFECGFLRVAHLTVAISEANAEDAHGEWVGGGTHEERSGN